MGCGFVPGLQEGGGSLEKSFASAGGIIFPDAGGTLTFVELTSLTTVAAVAVSDAFEE
jgi:hypothetical protein